MSITKSRIMFCEVHYIHSFIDFVLYDKYFNNILVHSDVEYVNCINETKLNLYIVFNNSI